MDNPRDLNWQDGYFEHLLANQVQGEAKVLWHHVHEGADMGAQHYLLLVAGEKGPRIVGASCWEGTGENNPRMKIAMDVLLNDLCQPMVPERSEITGLKAHLVHHSDRAAKALQASVQGATGPLRLHMDDATSGQLQYGAYVGRIDINGVRSIVVADVKSRAPHEEHDVGISICMPLQEFKDRVFDIYQGNDVAISLGR